MFPECQSIIDLISKRLPSNVTCNTCYFVSKRYPAADRHYTLLLENRSGPTMKITRTIYSGLSSNQLTDAFLWLYLKGKFTLC